MDAYNFKDHGYDLWAGETPVFRATSSGAVEAFLNAGLGDDLELVRKDGRTLLHECVDFNIVSEEIASSLEGLMGMKYKGLGRTPIEMGEKAGKLIFYNYLKLRRRHFYVGYGIRKERLKVIKKPI